MDRIEYVMAITAALVGVSVEEIRSKSRKKIYTEARVIITLIVRDDGNTWQKITDSICREDHASAIHWYGSGKKWLQVDERFREKYNTVKAMIDESYKDYSSEDMKGRAFIKIEACMLRVNEIMTYLNKELTEITALKSELNKQEGDNIMTTPAAEALYEAQHNAKMEGKKYATYNPNDRPFSDLPIIFGFNNGGAPGFMSGILVAEDGTGLGGHLCSSESYMRYDLGILEGSRADRHKTFAEHYPDGYRMDFIDGETVLAETDVMFEATMKRNQEKGNDEE